MLSYIIISYKFCLSILVAHNFQIYKSSPSFSYHQNNIISFIINTKAFRFPGVSTLPDLFYAQ